MYYYSNFRQTSTYQFLNALSSRKLSIWPKYKSRLGFKIEEPSGKSKWLQGSNLLIGKAYCQWSCHRRRHHHLCLVPLAQFSEATLITTFSFRPRWHQRRRQRIPIDSILTEHHSFLLRTMMIMCSRTVQKLGHYNSQYSSSSRRVTFSLALIRNTWHRRKAMLSITK